MYCFLRRHPDLKEKKAELIQLSRASACAPEVLEAWYKDFDKMLKENNITSPSQIFNCDESGFPLQTGPTGKVICDRAVSHAYQVTANNRTQITNLTCICANGTALCPAFLFPGKRPVLEYFMDLPPDLRLGFNERGWMDGCGAIPWVANAFILEANST